MDEALWQEKLPVGITASGPTAGAWKELS